MSSGAQRAGVVVWVRERRAGGADAGGRKRRMLLSGTASRGRAVRYGPFRAPRPRAPEAQPREWRPRTERRRPGAGMSSVRRCVPWAECTCGGKGAGPPSGRPTGANARGRGAREVRSARPRGRGRVPRGAAPAAAPEAAIRTPAPEAAVRTPALPLPVSLSVRRRSLLVVIAAARPLSVPHGTSPRAGPSNDSNIRARTTAGPPDRRESPDSHDSPDARRTGRDLRTDRPVRPSRAPKSDLPFAAGAGPEWNCVQGTVVFGTPGGKDAP